MRWRKLGLVYVPSGELWWARSNATFPVAEVISKSIIRVYFTSLDEKQRGRGGYVDVDTDDPTRIIDAPIEPVIDIGEPGDFDDAGANPFSVVTFDGRKLMYYQGWQILAHTPFALFTGLAVAKPGKDTPFRKSSHVPVLERIENERHIRGAPFVMPESGGLTMWYVASNRWQERDGQLYYEIGVRRAVSRDGVVWQVQRCTGLDPERPDEYAIGRPSVWKDRDLYRMCYSVRSFNKPYAIGYAESRNGSDWTRKDEEMDLHRSPSGWDSEMVCYPYVVNSGSRVLMFYNGNRHGRSGFGCAELVG